MPRLFLRTSLETDPQRSLFDPLVAGRSFERSAYRTLATPRDPRLEGPRTPRDPRLEGPRTPRLADRRDPRPMTGDLLRQRLADLDVKRRRAQIRARKALDALEPAPMELPFLDRAAS
jgi:hypothetical protein